MKRKITAGIATLALAALLVPNAFAASDDNQVNTAPTAPTTQNQQFYDQMFDWHKTWLDNAVKNNQLTEDQAKAYSQQFDQMNEFHSKYGMGPGMMGGMMGNGSGMGPGMMGNWNGSGAGYGMMGNGNGSGFGPGMMGNFNAPSSK